MAAWPVSHEVKLDVVFELLHSFILVSWDDDFRPFFCLGRFIILHDDLSYINPFLFTLSMPSEVLWTAGVKLYQNFVKIVAFEVQAGLGLIYLSNFKLAELTSVQLWIRFPPALLARRCGVDRAALKQREVAIRIVPASVICQHVIISG